MKGLQLNYTEWLTQRFSVVQLLQLRALESPQISVDDVVRCPHLDLGSLVSTSDVVALLRRLSVSIRTCWVVVLPVELAGDNATATQASIWRKD